MDLRLRSKDRIRIVGDHEENNFIDVGGCFSLKRKATRKNMIMKLIQILRSLFTSKLSEIKNKHNKKKRVKRRRLKKAFGAWLNWCQY